MGEKYSTRRDFLHQTTLAGAISLPLLSGCIEEEEEHPNRGETLSVIGTGRKNTFGPGSRRYWMHVPYYSEVKHSFEMKSSTEGYAGLGTLNLRIYKRPRTEPIASRSSPGWPGYLDEDDFDVVKTIEGIDIESNPELTHKIHPSHYSVRLDGSNLEREVELDWVAFVYKYLGDESNIDCSEQTEDLEVNYLYAVESGSRNPSVELIHDIQYSDTTSDTYELDLLLQTPTDEDRVQIHNESGFCTTPFVGYSEFSIEHPISDPYRLQMEVKDGGTIVASSTTNITGR